MNSNKPSKILISPKYPNPLKGLSKKEYVEKVINYLRSKNVESAYIFGSFNSKDFGPGSDIDLLIVWQTDIEFHKRCLEFPLLYELTYELDLLIYTPDEFNKKVKEQGSSGFWKNIINSKKIL